MGQIIATTEIFCILFLAILLYGVNNVNTKHVSTKLRIFRLLTSLTVASLALDALSYLETGSLFVLFTTNCLSYVFTALINLTFGYYVLANIREKSEISYTYGHINAAVNVLDIVLIIIGSFTGKIFYFEGLTFHYGSWASFICIPQFVSIIYLIYVIFKYRKELENYALTGLCSYLVAPLIALVLTAYDPNWSFAPPAIAVSIQVIFVLLVSLEINETGIRESILRAQAYNDTLTNLNNRRAYVERVDNLPNGKTLNLIFSDLNGLKNVNDSKGHSAGDELLKDFADILLKYFPKEDIFRISGDEFAIISTDMSTEDFSLKANELLKKIETDDDCIASIGIACGDTSDVRAIVRAAEEQMYKRKSDYYAKTGKDRRHL